MPNGKRSMGLFGVSGVLAAALIITAFVAMGGIFQAQGKGTLTVEVMDAPAETIDQLWLTIDEIKIQGDKGWVTVKLTDGANPIDLLTLKDVSAKLTEVEIPADDYSMIQMHVSDASASHPDDESTFPVSIPSGVIKVILQPKLPITEDEHTTVLVDLQPDDVQAVANGHTINIRPVVKSVIQTS